jgi:hypothetical protein
MAFRPGRRLPAHQVLPTLLELLAIDLASGEALLEDHECAIVADPLNDRWDDEVRNDADHGAEQGKQQEQEDEPADWKKVHLFS